jgi:hypothetical protein
MLETTPDKITLTEWQATQGSIFSHLIDTELVQYLEGTDAEMMSFLLASKYGNRKVQRFFAEQTAQEVGKMIHRIFSYRWQLDLNLFNEFVALEGDAVSTAQNDSTVGTDRSTSTNQVNKTSGFDGSELVDDNGADISGTDNTTNTASSTNKNVSVTQDGLLAKAQVVRERQFHESICEDIARLITISIY